MRSWWRRLHRDDVAADGEEGLFAGNEYPLDIAVIDLGLPKLPGLDLIRQLRKPGKTFPILILTARDRWQDKVEGLQAGADDYVAKPYHFEEVLARVQALLRRSGGWASADARVRPDRARHARADRHARRQGGRAHHLRIPHPRAHDAAAGDVISKTELTERLYEQDFERDSNVIEVFIGRLRRKLDPDETLQPIETLRGRGYRLVLPRHRG